MNYKKLFIGLFIFVLSFLITNSSADAATVKLKGWGWSSNIGYLSFNCLDMASCGTGDGRVDYGVTFVSSSPSATTGVLQGYAWSSNIGWVKFTDSGDASHPGPQVDLVTGAVTGWIRACSGTVNGDCTGADRTDGWDGWIKLSDPTDFPTSRPGGTQGISFDPTDSYFKGYSWGSEVVGWLTFSPFVGSDGRRFNVRCITSCVPVPTGPMATPAVTLDANPDTVLTNGTTTLTWRPSNSTSCTASGDWSGSKIATDVDHTEVQVLGSAAETYTIQCSSAFGISSPVSVTVDVVSTLNASCPYDTNVVIPYNASSKTVYPKTTGFASGGKPLYTVDPLQVVFSDSDVGNRTRTFTVSDSANPAQTKSVICDFTVAKEPTGGSGSLGGDCTVNTASITVRSSELDTYSIPVTGRIGGGNGIYTFNPPNLTGFVGGRNIKSVVVTDSNGKTGTISCEVNISLATPTSVTNPDALTMWLKHPDPNNKSLSEVTIRQGQPAYVKWEGDASVVGNTCRGSINENILYNNPDDNDSTLEDNFDDIKAGISADGYHKIREGLLPLGVNKFSMFCLAVDGETVRAKASNKTNYLKINVIKANIEEQ